MVLSAGWKWGLEPPIHYVILDVFSRSVVGWMVAMRESAALWLALRN